MSGSEKRWPRVHILHTFFYNKLTGEDDSPERKGVYNYLSVQKWTTPKKLKAARQASSITMS